MLVSTTTGTAGGCRFDVSRGISPGVLLIVIGLLTLHLLHNGSPETEHNPAITGLTQD